jgi:hypothetical protein
MKALSVILIALCIFVSCKNEESSNDQPASERLADKKVADPIDSASFTTVQWLDSLKDIGTVKRGDNVDITFRFKNTGDKPLLVQNVMAGCGCTVPERTEEPVLPGKEGFIRARFNSTNQHGTVNKTIEVVMNTKPSTAHTIAFIGDVLEK